MRAKEKREPNAPKTVPIATEITVQYDLQVSLATCSALLLPYAIYLLVKYSIVK